MESVSITELKAHLAEYLRRVQGGERFHVTVRGKEVAESCRPTRCEQRSGAWSRPARRTGRRQAGVPDGLPVNTGRLLSDIASRTQGLLGVPDPEGS